MKNILSTLLLTFTCIFCYGQKVSITKISDNNYKIRIAPDYFHYERVNRANDNYAWAACLAMVLNNFGLSVTQDQLIGLGLDGSKANALQDVVVALNTVPAGSTDRPSHIFCDEVNVDEELIFSELSNNRAVLAGMHAGSGPDKPNVVVAMTFGVKYNDKGEKIGITPNTITVVNPAVGAASQTIVNWSDFLSSANVLYTLKVSFN